MNSGAHKLVIIGPLLALSFIAASPSIADTCSRLERILVARSKDINKQLPMMVDAATRLDITMAAGCTLIYKYTFVNTALADVDTVSIHEQMEAQLVDNYCGMDNMREMLNDGVRCRYMYFDKYQRIMVTIVISKESCSGGEN